MYLTECHTPRVYSSCTMSFMLHNYNGSDGAIGEAGDPRAAEGASIGEPRAKGDPSEGLSTRA